MRITVACTCCGDPTAYPEAGAPPSMRFRIALRTASSSWKVIPPESQILREIRAKLEAVAIRTLREIAQAADLTSSVAEEYLRALEATGAIRIKLSGTRISTVALVGESP